MTFDKFTIKAQEAVQAAANLANANGQQAVEPIHLLGGIIEKDVTSLTSSFRSWASTDSRLSHW